MSGAYLVYGVWFLSCISSLFRPWIGLVTLFAFALLEPAWNWSWIIPRETQFQKYLFISTFAGWIISGFKMGKLSPQGKAAFFGLACFLGLAYLSERSTISPEWSAFYMQFFWKIIVCSLLAIVLIDTRQKLFVLLWSSSLAHGYNAFRLTSDYFDKGYCAFVEDGWAWTSSNQVANLAGCCSFISFALLLYSNRLITKSIAGCILALQLHEVMLLESRGVMLGCVVGLSSMLALIRHRTEFKVYIFLGIVGITTLAGPSVQKEFLSIFAGEEERDESADSRIDLWKAGLEITLANPVLGVGPYAAQVLVPQYVPDNKVLSHKTLHNLMLELSAGCGIPAAICYFLFFISPMVKNYKTRKQIPSQDSLDIIAACQILSAGGTLGFLTLSMFSAGALMQGSYVIGIAGVAATNVRFRESLLLRADVPQKLNTVDSEIGKFNVSEIDSPDTGKPSVAL